MWGILIHLISLALSAWGPWKYYSRKKSQAFEMETKSWTPCSNSCAVGVKSTQHLLGHVALAEKFGFIVSLWYRKICTMLFQQDCKVKTSLLCSTWTQSPPSSPPRFPPSPRSCSETFPLSLKWKLWLASPTTWDWWLDQPLQLQDRRRNRMPPRLQPTSQPITKTVSPPEFIHSLRLLPFPRVQI